MSAEGKLRYEKPDLTFWFAEQLNGIEAKMSRGPGGSTNHNVYVLFSAIRLSLDGDPLPFDHAALLIASVYSKTGYFYSYAAGPKKIATIATGAQGYLGTARTTTSTHAQITKHIYDIEDEGKVYTDFLENGAIQFGDDKSRYYRYIQFTVSQSTAIKLNNAALARLGKYGTYKFLTHNCYDMVKEILATENIKINYNKSKTAAFFEDNLGDVADISSALYDALTTAYSVIQQTEASFSIPNVVYDYFVSVTQNGTTLTPYSKKQFRPRGSV